MGVEYDERYHLHLGYYENNYDLECIAYKRKSEDVWDVFFDFDEYGLKNPTDSLYIDRFGCRIFYVNIKDLDYACGAEIYLRNG